jgi:hypothetical protein
VANKYKKALKILKSNSIDKKIKNLEESLPLNHSKGIYSLNPAGFRLGEKDPAKVYYPDVDGNWPAGIPGIPGELEYIRPAGYWGGGSDWDSQVSTDFSQDYLETDPTGRSTDKLIGEDGTVFSELPPGGENFILGPVVDGFVPNHTYDAYTNIGYLQKDTRQFVLLGRIQGQWKSGLNGSYSVWNGTSTGFTSYNQNFTLEMAQWVRDKIIADAYVSKVPYFYSGGVPQVPQSPADCPNCPPGMYGGNGVGPRQFGSGGNPSIGTEQDPYKSGGPDPNLPPGSANPNVAMDNMGGWLAAAAALGFVFKTISDFIDWFNKQSPEMKQKLMDLTKPQQVSQYTDDPSTWPSIKNPTKTPPPIIDPKTGWPSVPNVPPSYKGKPGGQPVRLASYNPQGQLLSEERKKIIKEIKKPYKLPELPKQKYKMNFSGKYSAQNTPDKTASKLSDDLVASGNAKGQRWRAQDKYWQGYETTERMNIIYDKVGHGEQYWDEIVKENQRKTSWKNKEIQEHLNLIAHEKAMREENPNYESPFYKEFIEEQETVQADKDPLFKKVSKRLKKDIDYPDKPAKNGVPNDPPPKMVNGYHPDFGKRKSYYNKLDPQSAAAMPQTGDPEIDSQVKAARKKPK